MARTRLTIVITVLAVLFVAGCTSATLKSSQGVVALQGSPAPTATLTESQDLAFGQNLFQFGCVCHPSGQKGAPPVSVVASLPESTIEQTVRQGTGPMPMWSTDDLSEDWLTTIIDYLQSTTGTPGAGGTAASPSP